MQGVTILLLLLVPSLAVATNDFDGSLTVQTGGSRITKDYCYIPCDVKYNRADKNSRISAVYFNVTWTFLPRRVEPAVVHEYHVVTDTEYWNKNYSLLLSVTDLKCSPGDQHTTSDGPLAIRCGLYIASCSNKTLTAHLGSYRCRVQQRFTGATFGVTSEIKHTPTTDPTRDGELPCYPPMAVNISAALLSVNESTEKVRVVWNATTKPGLKPYCTGARRWSVAVVPFGVNYLSEYRDNDDDLSFPDDIPGFFTPTSLPRTKFFEIAPLPVDEYYLFVIRNEYKFNSKVIYKRFASPIYYFGKQKSPYFMDSNDEVLEVAQGDTATIQCPVGGIPEPKVQLIRNGRVLGTLSATGFKIRDLGVSDVGDYYCSASNTHVNPPLGKRRLTVNKKITIHLIVTPNNQPCQPYNGGMCRTYVHEDTDILVHDASLMEATISNHIGYINTLSGDHRLNLDSPVYQAAGITDKAIEQCYEFTTALACNNVYQYCDASSSISLPVARPICKHTCALLNEDGPCGFFFNPSFLREQRHQLVEIKEALFAHCDNRTAPGGTSPECLSVSLHSPAVDQPEVLEQVKCVKGDGRSYAGDLSRTVSGAPCQAWYSQVPNTHSIVPAHFQLELFGASFSCRNPGGLGERPWCYTALEGGPRWEYCDPPQCESCQQYSGRFCSALTGYSERSVYLNREDWVRLTMDDVEGNMVGFYHSLKADSLSPACQNSLKLLICHGSLPFCTEQGPPAPLSSCVDHCTLVNETRVACPSDVVRELESRWSTNNRVTRLQGPNCSLPADPQTCMPSPEPIKSTKDVNTKCFNSTNNGQSYRGSVAKSISNVPCLDWSSTGSSFTGDRYSELIGAGNSCRNPGQWGLAPWCFVGEDQVELCLVNSCSGSGNRDDKSVPSNASSVAAPVILVLCLGFVFIVLAIGVGYMVHRHKRQQSIASAPSPQSVSTDTVKNVAFTPNDQYYRLNPKVADTITTFKQIPKAHIEYVKQLGQGCFGMVFKGKWKSFEGTETYVAIKTLKEDNNDGIEEFVNEAKLMFSFDHDNIVQILGVCMTTTPYYLVFEYMNKGDLAAFLRENASSLQRRFMNPLDRPRSRTESTLSDDPATLNREQLTDIVQQIAKGMEYLSIMNHVHRDLACRNCLVSSLPDGCEDTPSKVVVKIGDFGLSHNLYSKDYYRVKGNAVLPIRWMAPEAIIYGKFSTAGDVWSFGVVMWEVFTYGMQPYYGTSNDEVMEKVRHGKVLEKPTDCSDRLYAIMNDCWTRESVSRPSFTELRQYLEECRVSTSSEYDAQSVYSDISSDAFLEENSDPETEPFK